MPTVRGGPPGHLQQCLPDDPTAHLRRADLPFGEGDGHFDNPVPGLHCVPGKVVKPPRTHWDMLLERRSIEELEEILNERLSELKSRRTAS